MGSYVAIAAIKGGFLETLPENTLVLMGLSGGTLSFASIIRHIQEPQVMRRDKAQAFRSEKNPDSTSIAKVQMFSWTLVIITIYVLNAASNIAKGIPSLPNVDQTILGLMGIADGVYIANKVNDKPQNS